MFFGPQNRSLPVGLMRLSLEASQLSAGLFASLMPGQDNRLAWAEFSNRLQAFSLFQQVDSAVGLPSGRPLRLPEAVALAQALDPYEAVWATEGLGHYYAEACWESGSPPRGLLTPAQAPGLPRSSLIPLHAGMGLSMANRILEGLDRRDPDQGLGEAIERFVDLCRCNSWPGYQGTAIEALGLVARNLHPRTVPHLDRQLMQADEGLAAYFWHGVGRGIYFAPTNFLPLACLRRRGLEQASREPGHELGRRNALSGLAWALTLINIRHPEIVAAYVRSEGGQLPDEDAFSVGVASSLLVWRLSSSDGSLAEAFCRHAPGSSDPQGAQGWQRLVKEPCRAAMEPGSSLWRAAESPGRLFGCLPH